MKKARRMLALLLAMLMSLMRFVPVSAETPEETIARLQHENAVLTSANLLLQQAVAALATGSPVVCTAISSDQMWYKVTLPDQAGEFYILVADLQTGGKS